MQYIYYSIYILIAFGASIAVILALGLGLHFERFIRRHAVPFIPVFIALAIGISSIVSDRNVSFYGFSGADIIMSAGWYGGWVLRLTTALIVGASVVITLSALIRRDFGSGPGLGLIALFIAYFASFYIVSGIFGSEPSFSHRNFYALFVFFAAYVTRDQGLDYFLSRSRDGLNIFIALGLIIGITLPHIAVQKGYGGIIPGISFRFWGVAAHANNLGPIAVVFLLLLAWKPYKWISLNMISALAALVSLVLSQSKTAWMAALIAVMVWIGYHLIHTVREVREYRGMTLAQFAWLSIPAALIYGVVVIMGMGIGLGWEDKILFYLGDERSFLTGRNVIWSITLKEWQANPIFGYGPSLWGAEFAAKQGYLGVASNAHNQFVDALGSSGILGALCFSAYFFLLLKYAWSLAGSTRGYALALAIFVLVRCITEVPLKTAIVTTTDFLMHFILFNLLLRAKLMKGVKEESSVCPPNKRSLSQARYALS